MLSKQSFIEKIHADWGSKPQSNICIGLLDHLSRTSRTIDHITYATLRRVVDQANQFADEELLLAIKYLCGEPVHLLEMGFELIEDEQYIEIPKSEIKAATESGSLLHPETGELMQDFKNQVHVYFKPSELSKKLAS